MEVHRTRSHAIAAVLALLMPLAAQQVPPPPAAEVPALPAPGSPEATALVDMGIAKMLSLGRGSFHSTESLDSAATRGVGMPFGAEATEIDGGWHQDLVWGETGRDRYVRHAGRMVAKVEDQWKLRSRRLGSGAAVPFTVDPELLFAVLRDLPAEARRVEHIEAGEAGGRKVWLLSLTMTHELATEFVDCGVVPDVGSGFDGIQIFGGARGMQVPAPERTVHLALSIDPDNGDVMALAAKVYQKTSGVRGFQFRVQAGGGAAVVDDEEDDADGEPWRQGLPTRAPAKDESVLKYRIEFRELGLVAAPELDERTRQLLRLR